MMKRKKFYVVWNGHATGVFDSWEECKLQTDGYPEARFKSFDTQEEAIEAYRGDPNEYLKIFRAMSQHTASSRVAINPEVVRGSLAVDAACSRNPGPVEYQCVDIDSGARVFHVGPLAAGTNNIGEFLALVHVLALLDREGRHDVTIYSDSRTAMSWVRNGKAKTTLTPTQENEYIRQLVKRAEAWLASHHPTNRILKWDTERWGEIPADFGRK